MRGQRSAMQELRERAEQRLQLEPIVSRLPDERATLVHELRLHQVELQMQNDALRDTERELAISLARYHALYDLAPVACLSLDCDARIAELNRAAAALLGAEQPSELLGRRFSSFLGAEYSERFEHHRR